MVEVFSREPRTGDSAYKANHARMLASMEWRKKRKLGDTQWSRAMKLYRGDQWEDQGEDAFVSSENPHDRITVNITKSTVEDYAPFLVRTNPEFILKPRPKLSDLESIEIAIQRAKLGTYLINYFWQEYGVQEAYEKIVNDGLVIGHGIGKTGWVLELNEALNPRKDGKIEMDSMVRLNQPFARRVDPRKFFYSPDAPDNSLRTSRWAGELIFMPLSDVVNNKLFHSKIRTRISSGEETPTSVASYLGRARGDIDVPDWIDLDDDELKGQNLVVLWEFWDKKFEKYYVHADGIMQPLIEEDTPKFPYLDGFFPYTKYDFIPINGEHYPPGIPASIEDQQHEKNRIRTTEFNHRRKFGAAKFAQIKNGMDADQMEKLLSDNDEVITVNGPIDQTFQRIQFGSIMSDNYNVDGVIDEDVRKMLGLDALHTGGTLPSRTTGREIDARQNLFGTKLQGRVKGVDKLALDLAKQIWQHAQHNLTADQVVRIAGPEGQDLWERVPVKDIQGEFDFEVISSSKEEHDPDRERSQRLQIMEVVVNNAELLMQMGFMVNAPALMKFVLDSYDRPQTDDFIIPIPPQPEEGEGGEDTSTAPPPDAGQQMNQEQATEASALLGATAGGGPQLGV